MPTAFSTIWTSPRTTSPSARSATASIAVERTLDAAHALMSHGVHRYPGKKKLDLREEEKREQERRAARGANLQRSLAHGADGRRRRARTAISARAPPRAARPAAGKPALFPGEDRRRGWQPWQRELLRIVRHIAQYFYPQGQTKVMNEGTATYVHYRIMTRLHEQGRISRRQLPRIPAVAHQRGVPARLRRSALLGLQSLCARLCDDAGHRAHRHQSRRRGPRLVPRHRRQGRRDGRAARHLGQLSRRELHRASSSARG